MILVTGAGGTIGSALLGEPRSAGCQTRAAYHSASAADAARTVGHDATAVDLAEPDTLRPALAGVHSVFLIGAVGPRQTEQEGSLVEAARQAGAERLVKLSIWRAAEELTPFAEIHRNVERAVESSGLDWTFRRPNFFVRNFSRRMAEPIRTRSVFSQPETDARISFLDARDIARVVSKVLTSSGHEGQAYDLTGPEALSYHEAADVLSRVLDRKIEFVPSSDEQARAGMLARGVPEYQADCLIEVSRAYRYVGAAETTSAVEEIIGRTPLDFERFVRDHESVFR